MGKGILREPNYFLVPLLENASSIEDKSGGREVREDRFREPNSWDRIELESVSLFGYSVDKRKA